MPIRIKFNLFCSKTSYYAIIIFQIYIPLTLIVCCSWVQFWLTKTDIGGEIDARTTLGATTVLTVVTIGFIGKSKPQVNYNIVDHKNWNHLIDKIFY